MHRSINFGHCKPRHHRSNRVCRKTHKQFQILFDRISTVCVYSIFRIKLLSNCKLASEFPQSPFVCLSELGTVVENTRSAMKSLLFVSALALAIASTVGKPNDGATFSRVKQEVKLSDEQHFDEFGNHNPDYDHDAFLGEEEAKKFRNLSPAESKEKLGKLFDRVDADKNGTLSETELKNWIEHQQNAVLYSEVDRMFAHHDVDKDGKITWAEYNKTTFSNMPLEKLVETAEDKNINFRKKVRQDKARWAKADLNKDEALDREELLGFVYPREKQYMRDIAVAETIEDMDKDGDGFVDIDEFINDLWDGQGEEPDYVKTEREGFSEFRDTDGDGKMGNKEIADWIMPAHYDPTLSEAKHLMFETDTNKDKTLSREEVVENYKVFVGSRATNFGELRHDEF